MPKLLSVLVGCGAALCVARPAAGQRDMCLPRNAYADHVILNTVQVVAGSDSVAARLRG